MHPLIWNDETKIFEKIDIRENKWYQYKTSDDEFDAVFGINIINNDLSRLLMSFASV